MTPAERAEKIEHILIECKEGQLDGAVRLICSEIEEAVMDKVIEMCEGEDCFVARKEQEAYNHGREDGFKAGDKCTAESVMKAYRQGFNEAIEKAAGIVFDWTIWTPEHIEQLILKIRAIKPEGCQGDSES